MSKLAILQSLYSIKYSDISSIKSMLSPVNICAKTGKINTNSSDSAHSSHPQNLTHLIMHKMQLFTPHKDQ